MEFLNFIMLILLIFIIHLTRRKIKTQERQIKSPSSSVSYLYPVAKEWSTEEEHEDKHISLLLQSVLSDSNRLKLRDFESQRHCLADNTCWSTSLLWMCQKSMQTYANIEDPIAKAHLTVSCIQEFKEIT